MPSSATSTMPVLPGCAPPVGGMGQKLAQRLAGRADKYRLMYQQFGLRPYNVFLVWTRWGGTERGEGNERETRRVLITPSPKVQDLTAIALQANSAGLLPVGSVRISQVTTTLNLENLLGHRLPGTPYFDSCGLPHIAGMGQPVALTGLTVAQQQQANAGLIHTDVNRIPETYEFFYEMTNSQMGDQSPRYKFRLFSTPYLNAEKFGWEFVLERISEDRSRAGESQIGTDSEG